MSEKMRVAAIFAIRDARGLTSNEKALLYTVESRGVCFATWHHLAQDAGLGKDAFYRARKRLVEKGLLVQQRRRNASTAYRVDLRVLAGGASPSGSPESTASSVLTSTGVIPVNRNTCSRNPESKETLKGTTKATFPTEAEIRELVAIAPPFDDEEGPGVSAPAGNPGKPLTTAEIEAVLATSPLPMVRDPLRTPRTPHPKDRIYSRNALEREAKEQGFDPDTGEYLDRAVPRPRYRSYG